MTKSKWTVINKGKVSFAPGVKGSFGGEKPHISFWIDESQDVRAAIWVDLEKNTASFQITKNNELLDTSILEDTEEKEISAVSLSGDNSSSYDDDLPF